MTSWLMNIDGLMPFKCLKSLFEATELAAIIYMLWKQVPKLNDALYFIIKMYFIGVFYFYFPLCVFSFSQLPLQ